MQNQDKTNSGKSDRSISAIDTDNADDDKASNLDITAENVAKILSRKNISSAHTGSAGSHMMNCY